MEKQRLSSAFMNILKVGKDSGSCQCCFMIRYTRDLSKYTAGFCGPLNRSSYCSFTGENKGKLLNSPNDSPEGPKALSGATQHVDRFNNDQQQLSDQLQVSKNIYGSFSNQAGRFAKKLLHRAYLNLKDNQLLREEHSADKVVKNLSQTGNKSSKRLKTASPPAHSDRTGSWDKMLTSQTARYGSRIYGFVSETNKLSDSNSLTAKELFNNLMYLKYQYPDPWRAKILSAMFPDPEKLVYSVLKLAMAADDSCVQRLVVTDHLKQRYWKACLTLSWPKEIRVVGVHPEKDQAILGSYLRMCEDLKEAGLIYENEAGVWVPMTCEKVMTMLEKLSKYGESSLGSSRGRGFKIILEQIKDRDYEKVKISNDQTSRISETNTTAEEVEKTSLGSYLKNSDAVLCHESSNFIQENKDMWSSEEIALNNSSTDAVSQMAVENIENISIESIRRPNSGASRKPRWLCTIHVGWPFPFSVHAEGLSLPAAQILGYMSVVQNLKLRRLLTKSNSELCHTRIEHIVLSAAKHLWGKNIQQSTHKTEKDKFIADAKMFCDASDRGFGAFLTLTSTQKVSWFSEPWEGHRINVMYYQFKKPYLNSLLGELYTLVTAVFTWKHKLRSQRLLCYCDNLSIVSVVNSFVSEPAKEDSSTDPMDSLIRILQSTCHEYCITLQVIWLPRSDNRLADCLARRDSLAFQAAVPEAAVNKTKAKKLVFKSGSLL